VTILSPLPMTASVLGPAVWYFGDFVLDLPCFELRRNGASVRVEPQVFDVMTQLVKHHRRVVTKNELFDAVWGGRFVGEAALTSRIKAVRRALGDDGESQHYIRTVRGRGYRFVGVLIDPEADQAEDTIDADDWGPEMVLNLANPAGADRVSAPRPSTITRSRPNTRPRGTVDAA
jgi:DNA-binding winged helix-turn-helix (wHTH) protein